MFKQSKERIASIRAELEKQKRETAAAASQKQDNENLQVEVRNSTEAINSLRTENEQLRHDLSQLKPVSEQISSSSEEVQQLETTIHKLEAEKQEMQSEKEKISAERDQYRSDRDSLGIELAQKSTTIEDDEVKARIDREVTQRLEAAGAVNGEQMVEARLAASINEAVAKRESELRSVHEAEQSQKVDELVASKVAQRQAVFDEEIRAALAKKETELEESHKFNLENTSQASKAPSDDEIEAIIQQRLSEREPAANGTDKSSVAQELADSIQANEMLETQIGVLKSDIQKRVINAKNEAEKKQKVILSQKDGRIKNLETELEALRESTKQEFVAKSQSPSISPARGKPNAENQAPASATDESKPNRIAHNLLNSLQSGRGGRTPQSAVSIRGLAAAVTEKTPSPEPITANTSTTVNNTTQPNRPTVNKPPTSKTDSKTQSQIPKPTTGGAGSRIISTTGNKRAREDDNAEGGKKSVRRKQKPDGE